MVDEPTARNQMQRFFNYPGYPKDEQDEDELLFAFEEASQDAAHSVEIGDFLIRNRTPPECRFCPVPAEVYAAASATRPAEQVPAAPVARYGPKPGDEPFGGLHELIDERILATLRRNAHSGRTLAERESAKRFLADFEKKKKQTSEKENASA